MQQARSNFAWSFAVSALALSCGGSSKPAESSATSSEAHHAEAPAAATHESDDEASAAATPVRATCDDGTCTPCGDAICPSGWYCDESAHGGPACGWVPECAQKASCGCVKKALAGCSCEEQAGAAHVACK